MKKIKYFLSNNFLDDKLKIISTKYYFLGILIFGFLIRGRQYFADRSFWLDESFLANNFKYRNFAQLLEPLEYGQVAPIGFLWSEELMSLVFGLNELSLRFIPFISSIIAIYLIYDLSRILISKKIALIIAFAFTLPATLTYYSSELKQYSTDLFWAILLFWFFYRFVYLLKDKSRLIQLGLLGAIGVWFSNITPLILFSIGLAVWIDVAKKFSFKKLTSTIIACFLWAGSFFYYYVNFIKDHPRKEGMMHYWRRAFMPKEPIEAFAWLDSSFDDLFKNILGHSNMAGIALILFGLGLTVVILTKSKRHILFLVIPIIIHLILSYFKMYPFSGRLILYLIPIILIFEFIGVAFITKILKNNSTLILILISGFLLNGSYESTKYMFLHTRNRENIKPVLSYISNNKEKDDVVYLYFGSHAAFRFYKERYFSEEDNCIVGSASMLDFEKFQNEFEGLQNRVWVVFSHMYPPDGIEYLDNEIPKYKQLDYFEAEGAKVYLIDKI